VIVLSKKDSGRTKAAKNTGILEALSNRRQEWIS